MTVRIAIIGDTSSYSILLHNHRLSNMPIERLFGAITLEELVSYAVVILLTSKSSLQNTRQPNHSILREFVQQGGRLIILGRQGGDNFNQTNYSQILDGVSDRQDLVIDRYQSKFYAPIFALDINHDNLHFQQDIIYDGGCTYTVSQEILDHPDSFVCTPKTETVTELHPTIGHKQIGSRTFRANYRWSGVTQGGAILVHVPVGKGKVTFWGARWTFSDSHLSRLGHFELWRTILQLQRINAGNSWKQQLHKRMQRAQRHRLLHAYPMSSGMDIYKGHPRQLMKTHRSKRTALGIIPHTFCNTGRKGCGFCTFPHEQYSKSGIETSMQAVIKEIQLRKKYAPSFTKAPVSSIYIGGGTANLSRQSEWKHLLQEIATLPISTETELTLEGAPLYFWSQRTLLQDIASILPTIKKRISIGVQTFHPHLITLMGRNLMNNKLLDAIGIAKSLGFHISIDLLCNLPNQTPEEIVSDIEKAVALNIPHICVYNLVCYDGLGTEWASDPKIVAQLPSREQSMANMALVFQTFDRLGYDAITLTDFQKRGSGESGRYRYEEDIRAPESVNWWGVGPGGISVLWDRVYGVKLENPRLSSTYIETINSLDPDQQATWQRSCVYAEIERKLYWLTRQIKGLSINPQQYQRIFHTTIEDDFGPMFWLFQTEGLLTPAYALTQKGCYFADAMAGLLVEYAVKKDKQGASTSRNTLPATRLHKMRTAQTYSLPRRPQLSPKIRQRRLRFNDARSYPMG